MWGTLFGIFAFVEDPPAERVKHQKNAGENTRYHDLEIKVLQQFPLVGACILLKLPSDTYMTLCRIQIQIYSKIPAGGHISRWVTEEGVTERFFKVPVKI